jgi:OOP family OmpA-OmpF porin
MKSVLYFAACATLTITVLTANAADFYVGAAVGPSYSTNATIASAGQSINLGSSGHATPLKAVVGIDLNENFGLEAGYKTFGSTRIHVNDAAGTALEGEGRASYFAAKGMLPLSDDWTLIGKLGVGQRHFGITLSSNGQSASDSTTQSALYAGVGVAYKLTKSISLTAELEQMGEAQVQGLKLGMNGFSAGVRFGF